MPLPKVVRLVDYVIVSRSHFALSTGALTPVNRLGYNRLDTIMPGVLVQRTYSRWVLFLLLVRSGLSTSRTAV